MKIVSIVGTRPQLIKAAALQPVLRTRHEEIFVDTGQHWDESMAGAFLAELGLARPDRRLGLGGGTHADQTAAMLTGLEPILAAEAPDAVRVYGDTNSTLAGVLAAAKLGIPVAHVEAGLRSFDRRMPEEVNRVVADHLATWLLAPTRTAVENLRAEGITRGVTLVGDLMQDLASRVSAEVRDPSVLEGIGERLGVSLTPGGYVFATVHRQENREAAAMAAWAAILSGAASPHRPVIVALHPGTRAAMGRARISCGPDVAIVEPQGYRTSLALQLHAAAVITDSGGVQREAAWLGVPCLVLRESTEWLEAVDDSAGRMVIIGLDRTKAATELTRLAPVPEVARLARERAATLDLPSTGAAHAIVTALEQSPGPQAPCPQSSGESPHPQSPGPQAPGPQAPGESPHAQSPGPQSSGESPHPKLPGKSRDLRPEGAG
ncbi:MAG: UDP-N-acetylglucosamine 2-epimerase (non-hydrolyzing) [Chloroflexi bacterium]|nr:UDP-N-acetylglucosamine 2-epimerase (non-hydrolyzing) [Chloroflexota bacterium]